MESLLENLFYSEIGHVFNNPSKITVTPFEAMTQYRNKVGTITYNKDNKFVVQFVIPGTKKEDIKLEVERLNEVDYLSLEAGKYKNSIPIPLQPKKALIKATYENGVLEVTFEKSEPKKFKIEVE